MDNALGTSNIQNTHESTVSQPCLFPDTLEQSQYIYNCVGAHVLHLRLGFLLSVSPVTATPRQWSCQTEINCGITQECLRLFRNK